LESKDKKQKSGKTAVNKDVKKTGRKKAALSSPNEESAQIQPVPVTDSTAEKPFKGLLGNVDDEFTLIGVVDKFRSGIIYTLIAFMVITAVAFYFSDPVLHYINKPFLDSGNRLNIFTIVGGFMLRFKVSAALALLLMVPVFIYLIWKLLAPMIDKSNRGFSRITIIFSILLFYAGVAFVFFFILPAAVKVMLSFVGKEMLNTIEADNYLSFIIYSCLIMGVLFEVPIIILVLTRLGIISPAMLTRKRRYAIVIIWFIAAVVTPQPDPMSQAMVGIPLMIIYEISIIISKIVARRELKKLL